MTDTSTIFAPGAGAAIRNRDDLVEALRARKAELGLANSFVDHALLMASGGTDKILGPTQAKGLTLMVALDMVELFGCKLLLVPCPETESRMKGRWERRVESQVRPYKRVSMKLIEACRPTVLRELASKAGKARMTTMTAAARRRIARLAARARWARPKRRNAA